MKKNAANGDFQEYRQRACILGSNKMQRPSATIVICSIPFVLKERDEATGETKRCVYMSLVRYTSGDQYNRSMGVALESRGLENHACCCL